MGLELVELVMAFEEVFGVAITDEEGGRAVTPRAVMELIEAKLAAQGRLIETAARVPKTTGKTKPWTQQEIRAKVRQIIREQLNVDEFSDDDSFVDDMGCG